ncbi:MAG: CYTH domain-containing protein [Deltaproteobacteria bacterium]|jgi:CYTH domain-containing protein|nr:CYTH domain-containing protein [Deltaproteobacteria bacterium]
MGREIERKFLLRNEGWRGLAPGKAYVQGYLADGGAYSVRVRIADGGAALTVKGATAGASRAEFTYAIPFEDARRMLDALARRDLIEKTRYIVEHKGFVWEIDEFHGRNQGLVVAEIELEREDQAFEKPDWIGEEVTGDLRYYNASLARAPYGEWRRTP